MVPAAPGGVIDRISRILAQRFSEAWGRQFVVEHRPGANNQLAAEYVTKAPPDGYTLMVSPEVTFAVNPSLYKRLPYDPFKGFTPIAGLVIINHGLITHPSLPVENVKDLLELARKKPGWLNYGTFGAGSTGHLNMEMLQTMSGTKFTAVHYKGATPALTDVIGGHIQMMFVSVGTVVPQWQERKVKFIAVGAAERMPLLPRDADRVGKRRAGLRGGVVVRAVRTARHAARGRRQAQCRGAAHVRRPGVAQDARPRIFHADRRLAGGTDGADQADEPKWRKVIQDAGLQPQ